METKKRRLSIKLTQEDFDAIHRKAEKAGRNLTDYVTACCLGKRITVIPDMAEVLRQQRGVGVNLNRLATLANMGRITTVSLDESLEELRQISTMLREILERGGWRK